MTTQLEWVDSFQIQSLATIGDLASFARSQVDLLKEWNAIGLGNNTVGVVGNATNRGTSALYIPFGGSIIKTLSHQGTYTIGVRIKTASLDGVGGINSLYDLLNNSQILFSIIIRTDGSVYLYAENNQSKIIVDTVVPVIQQSVETYIEVTATISGTTPLNVAAQLWVNDTSYGSGNINCSLNASDLTSLDATFNRINLNAGVSTNGQTFYWDLYIVKGTNRLGQSVFPFGVEIDPIFTISDSTPIDWTPTGGASHWDQINDNPPNNELTYVEAVTSGLVDSYNWDKIPNFIGTVPSVFLKFLARSTAEGLCQIQGNVGAGGTQEQTSKFALCDIDQYYYQSFDTDPLTGLAWLPSAFNSRPFGIQLV